MWIILKVALLAAGVGFTALTANSNAGVTAEAAPVVAVERS